MSQVNVGPGGERDTGTGTVLAILLVLLLAAVLVWGFAFGGFNAFAGTPSYTAPASSSPSVNVQPPAGQTGGTAGGTTAPSGTTGGTTAPSGGTTSGPTTGGAYKP